VNWWVSAQHFKSEAEQPHLDPLPLGSGCNVSNSPCANIGRRLTFGRSGPHGSSLIHVSSLSDRLLDIRVIQANGTLQNVTDEATTNSTLALSGIITRLLFPVVPLFKVQLADAALLDIAQNGDGIYVYL
jgi:hypothetical protein